MKRTSKSTSIHVRLDRKLLADVGKVAADNERTVSDWVRLVVKGEIQRCLNSDGKRASK